MGINSRLMGHDRDGRFRSASMYSEEPTPWVSNPMGMVVWQSPSSRGKLHQFAGSGKAHYVESFPQYRSVGYGTGPLVTWVSWTPLTASSAWKTMPGVQWSIMPLNVHNWSDLCWENI